MIETANQSKVPPDDLKIRLAHFVCLNLETYGIVDTPSFEALKQCAAETKAQRNSVESSQQNTQ